MSDGYGNDWDGLPLFKPGAPRKEQIKDMVGFVKQKAEAYARRTDPDTSHKAARHVQGHLPSLEQEVLRSINSSGEAGQTIAEVERKTGIPIQTCSPRLAPLRRKGFIYDSGERRAGNTSRKQIVWKAKVWWICSTSQDE